MRGYRNANPPNSLLERDAYQFADWQPNLRARLLRQNFCEWSDPQGMQGQLEELEMRMSERSEFPYFPVRRRFLSWDSSCFDKDAALAIPPALRATSL